MKGVLLREAPHIFTFPTSLVLVRRWRSRTTTRSFATRLLFKPSPFVSFMYLLGWGYSAKPRGTKVAVFLGGSTHTTKPRSRMLLEHQHRIGADESNDVVVRVFVYIGLMSGIWIFFFLWGTRIPYVGYVPLLFNLIGKIIRKV